MSNHPGLAGASGKSFSAGGRHAAHDPETDEPKREDRAILLAAVARDARLDRKFLLLITLSAAIATLGMLQNSTAVVIGAMLVSPLLGPIMGLGFGLATLESGLIRRSLVTLSAGMAVAILVAMILIWLSPIQDVTDELRARTQPTLLDLGVAVVGGVAGVYSIMKKLSGVMVGVAIATALVPPLSTIGFGLATWRPEMAIGAALLFLTNTLAIAIAATVIARINRFGPHLTAQHTLMQVLGIIFTLGVLSVPLALSLNSIVREVAARSVVQTAMTSLLGKGDKVDTLTVKLDGDAVKVDGVVLVDHYMPKLTQELSGRAGKQLDRKVEVNLVQLRQQSNSAVQTEDLFNQRLTALERQEAETGQIISELTVGGLIERSTITLDPQAKRAIVMRPADETDGAVAAAINRIIESAQTRHPEWLIEQGSAAREEDQSQP